MNMELKVAFDRAIAVIDNYIPYDFRWEARDGSLSRAVTDTRALGQVYVSIDPKGRQIIILSTVVGNVVVYEREAGLPGHRFELVVEAPAELRWFVRNVDLTVEYISNIIGVEYIHPPFRLTA